MTKGMFYFKGDPIGIKHCSCGRLAKVVEPTNGKYVCGYHTPTFRGIDARTKKFMETNK
jgi:hypothetical protein